MKYNQVGWFEIPVIDIDRAKAFYETLFQIELKRADRMGYEILCFPSEEEGKKSGVSGALFKGDGYYPASAGSGVVIYFMCNDMDSILKRAYNMGGNIVLPKKDIGEHGSIAWIYDSEGNIIALMMPNQ